jgi:hypothetical protein
VLDDEGKVTPDDLYNAYKNWSKDVKEFQLNAKQFSNYLLKRGFTKRRDLVNGKDTRLWFGVKLRTNFGVGGGSDVYRNGSTSISFN